jgi:heat shock protein HslJ
MELFLVTSVRYSENKMEMKMKKSITILVRLLIIAGSMLTACSGNASASLAGTWKLTSYGSPANLTAAAPNVDASVIFGPDGKVTGNVGCNGFSGDYKVDSNKVAFGSIASTLMACADPIAQQEGVVFNVFTNTASFKIDGNTLTVTSADGKSAVVFEKK